MDRWMANLGALAGLKNSENRPIIRWGSGRSLISALLLLAGCACMSPYGDFRIPAHFALFWVGYGLMSLGFILSWGIQSISLRLFWAIALLTRLILLPMYPGDDLWRYLWEGLVQHHGFSPYALPPTAPDLEALRTDWWPLINHPTVSAIYPPLTQLIFRVLAAIAPTVLVFKLAIIAADLAVCYWLTRRFGPVRALTYGWNPLILYSFAGGGHYDSWLLLALTLAWLNVDTGGSPLDRAHYGWSAFWAGASIALKWISAPLLGFIIVQALRHSGWRTALRVGLCGLVPVGVTAIPYCSNQACPLIPTGSSFVTHGRSAELIPYGLRYLSEASRQENWIFAIPLGLFTLWLLVRVTSFARFAETYLIGLLVLSPIVHAWYFTWLIPFAAATQNWGTRWVSISSALYFVLPYRQALGHKSWHLSRLQRLGLWTPAVVGWLASAGRSPKSSLANHSDL